jgi:hypothetical protein
MKRASAVVLTAAVVAAALWLAFGRGPGAGPFAWPKDAGRSVYSFPVDPGQGGAVSLWLGPIDRRAVLLDVRPADGHAPVGLTVTYAATVGPGTPDGAGSVWKPRAWRLRPVAGFTIPAHVQGHVMVRGRANRPGHYLVPAFIVDYKIGGTRYSALQHVGLEVCIAVHGCGSSG